jgi:AGZA family xanthine/uracil permease-like MFS transporter
VLVGAMMLEGIRSIEWDDYAVAIPVFLTIVAMPLTFSIANGVSFGVISYAGLKLLSGRGPEVNPLLYAVAAVLVARYVWLS